MLNRAVVQPEPTVALGLAADTMAAAAGAESLDDLFLRLEAAGVMLRIDPDVVPTMAKTPTLGVWELDLLRTVEDVVRLGHIQQVTAGEIVLDGGVVPLEPGSLVVHCAASGLQYPPLVPLWSHDSHPPADDPRRLPVLQRRARRLRGGDPRRRPGAQPPVPAEHPARQPRRTGRRMQVRGTLATRAFGAEPDIAAWANGLALNPARIEPLAARRARGAGGSGPPGRGGGARPRPPVRARRRAVADCLPSDRLEVRRGPASTIGGDGPPPHP